MKKLIATALITAGLLVPATAFAQSINPCDAIPKPSYCIGTAIGPIVGQLVGFIFVVAVILALGFLVYGGIRWITSGGDKTGVETARNTIIAAIIGLIVVFLAYVILNLVLQFLTGTDISNISVPTLNTCAVNATSDGCTPTDSCNFVAGPPPSCTPK